MRLKTVVNRTTETSADRIRNGPKNRNVPPNPKAESMKPPNRPPPISPMLMAIDMTPALSPSLFSPASFPPRRRVFSALNSCPSRPVSAGVMATKPNAMTRYSTNTCAVDWKKNRLMIDTPEISVASTAIFHLPHQSASLPSGRAKTVGIIVAMISIMLSKK